MRHFSDCCKVYRDQYNEDNGILPVVAVTAVPLNEGQVVRLTEKLSRVTGKTIALANRVDPSCLGGVRLEFEEGALEAVAEKALQLNTGARGLRSVMEGIMTNVMFQTPSDDSIHAVVITPDAVEGKAEPTVVRNANAKLR